MVRAAFKPPKLKKQTHNKLSEFYIIGKERQSLDINGGQL